MAVLLSNNGAGVLASSIAAGATSITLQTGEGARFPSPAAGDWFPITLLKSSGQFEICRCTARSGDTLTITRAQEGTTALAFSAGDRAELRLTVNALAGSILSGFRNKIINGKMEIAQRGTSFPAIGNNVYSLDRWRLLQAVSTAVGTITQQPDVPSSNEFQNSLRYTVTTADASLGATERTYLTQPIEGYNVRDLIGRTFTLSFWVRSSKTGIHCLALKSDLYDRTWVAEYTINSANTWEFKTITVSGGLITAGAWNWTNGFGLEVAFTLASGSNFNTTANAWQTGDFLATANQVNVLDTVGNIFAITGVQLEVGSVATPFEHTTIEQETARCQRYFYRLDALEPVSMGHFRGSTTVCSHMFKHPVKMRAAPTAVFSSAAAFNIYSSIGAPTSSANVVIASTDDSIWIDSTSAVAATSNTPAMVVVASGSYLDLSAEL